LVNIQRQSYWDVYFYICPKSLGFTPILNIERNRAELSALSVGHAYTDELNIFGSCFALKSACTINRVNDSIGDRRL